MTADQTTDLTEETPDLYGAYPRLSPHLIAALADCGERRPTYVREVLYKRGRQRTFFVIVRGTVAIVEGLGSGDEHVLGLHGPGRFLGEISLPSSCGTDASFATRPPPSWPASSGCRSRDGPDGELSGAGGAVPRPAHAPGAPRRPPRRPRA